VVDLPVAESPFTRLPVGRPVDRYRWVAERCRGLRVLDLGAYDESEVDRDQHPSWRWLHAEIAAEAAEVLGVDASEKVRAAGEIATSCGTRIVHGTVDDLGTVVADFRPDLVVAGELIEHTQDTLGWLSRLAVAAPGTGIVLTTPNATALVNVLLGLLGRESNHPDHLHLYSYRTLATLASRVPITDARIGTYLYEPHIFRSRVPRWAGPVVTATNRIVMRPIQRLFPLLAFGLTLEGRLG
jgi:hypothetical protein